MLEWIPVDSEWAAAIAYEPDLETIHVRFHSGVEWSYEGCPAPMWAEFSAPTTSKGKYIKDVLNHRPNRRRQ